MQRPARDRMLVVVAVTAIVVAYAGYLAAAPGSRNALPAASAAPTTTTVVPRHPVAAPVRSLAKDLTIFPLNVSTASWRRLLALAQAAGTDVIGTDVSWAQLEPDGPAPAHEFALLDHFVAAVRARHMRLRFQVVGFPDWARDPGQPPSEKVGWLPPVAPDEMARWSAFLGRLARHFRGKVSWYEVWNEPNIVLFWHPVPSPAQYATMLESSYLAVKKADPAAQVMFAGMAFNDMGFLGQVYDALDTQFGAAARTDHHFFDVLAVHPYSGSRPPTLNTSKYVYADDFGLTNGNFLGFEALHQLMAAHGEGWKGVYVTEYGFTTLGSAGFPPISDATRAQYLRTAWQLLVKIPYVVGFSWYTLYPNQPFDVGWSMLEGSGTHWQVTLTYRAFAALRAPGARAPAPPRRPAKPKHKPARKPPPPA